MYELILTDLDGTLLDDTERHYKCYMDIVEKYGGTPVTKARYWELKRNKIKRTLLLEETGFRGTYGEYMDEWTERIEQERYLREETVREGTYELLEFLKKNTQTLVLVTMRNNEKNLRSQLEWLHMPDYFDKVLIGNSLHGNRKADIVPEQIKDIKDKKSLMLGDTEEDGELADKTGSYFIAVTSGLRDARFLKADYYVSAMEEVKNCPVWNDGDK